MVKIIFVVHEGDRYEVDAEAGMTIMEAAIMNNVPGIDADCGGACACATCHVYIESGRLSSTGGRNEMEEDMLDFAFDVRDNSRLSCQITIGPDLEGLIVHIPVQQG